MDETLRKLAIKEACQHGFYHGLNNEDQKPTPDLGLSLLYEDYSQIYFKAYHEAYMMGLEEKARIESLKASRLRAEREAREQNPQARDRDV